MTDVPEQPSLRRDASPEIVPESWPPVEPIEPVKPWRIHWLLALPATIPAMLLPRRMGPHLAGSSWAAAYVAHVLSIAIAIGASFAFGYGQRYSGTEDIASMFLVNPLTELRHALAGFVLLLYGTMGGLPGIVGTLAVTAVIQVVVWIGPLILIPFQAAGEGPRRTYLRGVKLLLWSSACHIPIWWLLVRLVDRFVRWGHEAWFFAMLLLLALWWLSVVIRLGGRYAGPGEGPRWEPRAPRCEACGYSLVSLPLTGRCPECGANVHDSLPERRSAPAFATARGFPGHFVGFFRTTWRVLFAQDFGKRVTVWSHHRAARSYAFLVCVLIGLIAIATALAAHWQYHWLSDMVWWGGLQAEDRTVEMFLGHFEYLAATAALGIGAGLGGLACTLLVGLFLSWFGFRNVARRVVVLCCTPALLLVPLLLGIVGGWAAYAIIDEWSPLGSIYISGIGRIEYDVAVGIACLLPGFIALYVSFRRLRLLLRQTRFANA